MRERAIESKLGFEKLCLISRSNLCVQSVGDSVIYGGAVLGLVVYSIPPRVQRRMGGWCML